MTGRGGRQIVPRPPDTRPGRPAPWAELGPDERRFDTGALRRAFTGRVGRPVDAEAWAGNQPSAVLAPFYDDDEGRLTVVLTRRSWELRNHTGEVSFPGGRSDPQETPVTTALREAQEEIDLDPALVDVLGELDHYVTLVSRSFIVPVVGLLAARPELKASAGEVDEILHVPVAELLADEVFREEVWRFPPDSAWMPSGSGHTENGLMERSIYFFELAGDTVWGATANMLQQLLSLALGLPDGAVRS